MPPTTPTIPVALTISDMSCDHCVAHVRRALEDLPGVRVDHVAIGSARLTIDPTRTTPEAAAAAVEAAGYPAQITPT